MPKMGEGRKRKAAGFIVLTSSPYKNELEIKGKNLDFAGKRVHQKIAVLKQCLPKV